MYLADHTRGPKEIWDYHSSHQRVYFAEEIKQRISFFLSDKLFGKNLELGGGWYLTHPGSTVVDISPKALEYNPAKEKHEFNLDSINDGAKMPFSDHSFDHATMISVYQYLKGGEELRNELMRVLKPGAELYIINLNGAGLSGDGVIQGSTHISGIQKDFVEAGCTTLVENIPFRADITDVQSLCVVMPDRDLFGPNNGYVRNRTGREHLNEIYSRYKPYSSRRYVYDHDDDKDDETRQKDYFTEDYARRELKTMNDLFYKIATYPVTAYSVNYKKNMEAFTQECLETTDCIPIITSYHHTDIGIDMATSENSIFSSMHIKGKKNRPSKEEDDAVMALAQKYGLRSIHCSGHFRGDTVDEIIENYEKREQEQRYDGLYFEQAKKPFDENEQAHIISFLAEIPLNSATKELQDRLYALVTSRGKRDEPIFAQKDVQHMRDRKEDYKQRKEDYQHWKLRQAMSAASNKYDAEEEDEKPWEPTKPEPLKRPWYCQIDQRIIQIKARSYFHMLSASKQRRKVEELLTIKDQCMNGKIETAGQKTIDYLSYIPYFPKIFDNKDAEARKGSKMAPDY